jgi:hypothetical protein
LKGSNKKPSRHNHCQYDKALIACFTFTRGVNNYAGQVEKEEDTQAKAEEEKDEGAV